MARRRTKKAVEVVDDERPPRHGRFLRRLAVLGILLVGFIAVAPFLIANSPLRDLLLNWQMPVGGWQVRCQNAGFSWIDSQSLTNVTILDPDGQPLATLDSLTFDRSLLALMLNSSDLGTLRIVKPAVQLFIHPGGSNWGDFLSALNKHQAASKADDAAWQGGTAATMNLEIVDGSLQGHDSINGQSWNVQQINLTANQTGQQLTADGAATIANADAPAAGRLKFRAIPTENGGQQFDVLAEGLSLDPLSPWLSRLIDDCQLTGTTAFDFHLKRELTPDGDPVLSTWGTAEVTALQLTGAQLRGDKLRLQRLMIPWKLATHGEHLTVEQLKLEGDWLSADAEGTLKLPNPEALAATDFRQPEFFCKGKISLAKLAAMLPNAFQIREGVRLLTGDLTFAATADKDADDYKWSTVVSIEDISGEHDGRKLAWKDPLEASIVWADSESGPQLNRAYLKAPFANAEFEPADRQIVGKFDCDLAILNEKLSQFVDLKILAQGAANGALSFSVRDGDIQISSIQGRVNKLRLVRDSISIDEPLVEFSGDLGWNRARRSLSSGTFQLTSSAVAFRTRDLQMELPPGQTPIMTGDLAIRADLERMSRAGGVTGSWPRGAASSVMRFSADANQVSADFTFDAENLELVKQSDKGPPAIVWSEPKLHSEGKAIYEIATDRASIDNLRIDGQTLNLAGAAVWEKARSGGPVLLNGNLQYDPRSLAALVANYTGPAVQIDGDGSIKFEARGLLPSPADLHWSRSWQARAETGWARAAVFGLPVSAARLQGTLAEGQLRTQPLDISIGAGRLTTQPLVIFDPQPSSIIIPAGPLLTNVQISPAVSEQMLKYVAPILAGATRIDGQFSLDLADTRIPLDEPKQTRTAGTLGVHQLTVLPGPLLLDIVSLLDRIQSLRNPQELLSNVVSQKPTKLLTMSDQKIEFKVEGGRVYHRKLEFVIDDVPISSSGSVGFDQTLALVIAIPIQDRWIDGEQALSGLRGQALQIPIEGTFQRPRIDERAIADITRLLIRNTAGEAIGNEINRQLEKLFRGK